MIDDWIPGFHNLFYQRYFAPLLPKIRPISNSDVNMLVESFLFLLNGFEEYYRTILNPTYSVAQTEAYINYATNVLLPVLQQVNPNSPASQCPIQELEKELPSSKDWSTQPLSGGLYEDCSQSVITSHANKTKRYLEEAGAIAFYPNQIEIMKTLGELFRSDRIRYYPTTLYYASKTPEMANYCPDSGSDATYHALGGATCPQPDAVYLSFELCEEHRKEGALTLIHEGRHRLDFKNYWFDLTYRMYREDADPELRKKNRGRLQIWSEVKAYRAEYEALLKKLGRPPLADSAARMAVERKILENCILNNKSYKEAFRNLYKICNENCAVAEDVLDQLGHPWNPAGKASPWASQ